MRETIPSGRQITNAVTHTLTRYAAEDKYKDVYFVKIDVDKLNDLSKQCDVRKMPTFQLYKDGEKITQVAEPKPNDLTEFLAKAL